MKNAFGNVEISKLSKYVDQEAHFDFMKKLLQKNNQPFKHYETWECGFELLRELMRLD